ncbi:MAG TPA: type II secretion system F family protein [Bryobacteraceae bacterium]|jgi:tight adherence protein B
MILVFSFLLLLAIVMFSIALGVVVLRAHERRKVRGFLAQLDEQHAPVAKTPLVMRAAPSAGGMGPVSTLLGRLGVGRRIDLVLLQAGMEMSAGQLVLRAAGLMAGGAVLGFLLRGMLPEPVGSLVLASLGALIPVWGVRRRRSARIKAFEAQFPDALEFLSRSMLAGHGFTSSVQLLTEESPEPLAGVFRLAHNEIQLGSPLDRALAKIAEQIPLVDVRFFVSAVLMQQTSGGNLADILNKLAFVVRERFRLAGEVRAASAHGRLTSMVLIGLPVMLTIALLVMDPEYLTTFAHEPEGRFLLIAAVVGQLAGHLIIRRIVDIRV